MYAKIELQDYHWEEAEFRVSQAPVYKGSHREKAANVVGFLGEVVAEAWFTKNGINYKDERSSTDKDYIVGGRYSLDVKTKDRTVRPKIDFDNSVPLYNHEHQRPDYYLFISLLRNKQHDQTDIKRFSQAFVVGAIDICKLDKEGRVWKKDEVDQSNGTKFWTDCINVKMNQLIPKDELLIVWRE